MALTGPLRTAAQAAYGALFAVALPLLLWGWARATAGVVRLPALHLPLLGGLVAAAGLSLIALGVGALWAFARGLPMNAFPPGRFVAQGVYRYVPHPIYLGFCAAVAGCAVATGSASGLWLVAPVACAACAALVLGYEGPALRERFGPQPPPLLWLPPDTAEPATPWDRLSTLLLALAPWGLGYGAMMLLGTPSGAIPTYLPFEGRLPVIEEAELLYASVYPVLLFTLPAPQTRGEVRRLMRWLLLSSALVYPIYLALPLVAPPRPFEPHGALGQALLFERFLDTEAAAFPSFHVIFACSCAPVLARRFPRLRALAWAWALSVSAACVLTSEHSILDVLSGFLVAWLVHRPERLWRPLRAWAERQANGFRAVRLGPARVLVHCGWAGLATAAGVLIASAMLGPGGAGLVALAAGGGLAGSFLFARLVERPPKLARPYGFWGGLLGICAASACAPLFGRSPWMLLAGFCAGAPLVQALGRIRCLGQGCCHGAPCSERVGFRVDPALAASRVVKAGLGGAPLHPTQLYSILWNVLCGLAMLRLWWVQVPAHFLGGAYLILAGLGRFVEEEYRGEPQTPVLGGLRLYQWIAIASLIAGAAITALASSNPVPLPRVDAAALVAAIASGLVTWFALGVDFPESQRRWSRLA